MYNNTDILAMASRVAPSQEQLSILQEREQQVPGTVQYVIRRYRRDPLWNMEDTGMMVYHYQQDNKEESYLELKFCVSGNIYCGHRDTGCNKCRVNLSRDCQNKQESVDLLSFRFSPGNLSQFVKPRNSTDTQLGDDVLSFRRPTSFTRQLSLCSKSRMALEAMLNNPYTGSLENIFVNAQIQMLLLHTLDGISGEKEINIISCKFLANEADRDKINKAREVLIEHIGEPITIKELSRKVAMNECYLKKGFKEMFGATIFEFYQSQRMEHAKYLLYEKGQSVTDVSMMLGYSSISHFSTAFKKHTGLKPCELLFR
ncbi:MAG: AraC family transcriptional regulator [Chitinophagaceae bacterium]